MRPPGGSLPHVLQWNQMGRPHRPFWVLRHRVTGKTKTASYADNEDGMWEVLLTDGSNQPRAATNPLSKPRIGGPTLSSDDEGDRAP